jgi:hypothetical protein
MTPSTIQASTNGPVTAGPFVPLFDPVAPPEMARKAEAVGSFSPATT